MKMKQPHLGRKIADLRKSKGFTQEELVEKCNLNVRTLQRIEAGEVSPRSYTQRLIFKALEYDIHESDGTLSIKIEKPISVLGKGLGRLYRGVLDLFNLKTHTMRKVSILAVTAILIGLGLTALTTKSNAQTIAEVTEIIAGHNANYIRWFNDGQVDSLLTIYRADACIMPFACGKAELRILLQSDMRSGFVFKDFEIISVSVCDTIAVEKGRFTIYTGGGDISGMYMSEWRYSNKRWQTVNDIARFEQ
jgi:transcriptional regulator with XRE-family HTH domain